MSSHEPMEEEPGSPGPPPLEDQNGMEVTAPVQKSAKAIQGEVRQRWMKQRERRRLDLSALNPYIVCALCKGYLIDPVSTVECLHSFCKSCIVKHVETSRACPTCDLLIHQTKPLLSLRADSALQDIVYKVVPGLYRAEMSNRAKFYSNHPEAEPLSLEDAGEISDRLFFSPEDDISMSIEYFDSFSGTEEMQKKRDDENQNRRFLQCPGSVTVGLLKKFIMTKYGLDQNFLVDVIYKEDLLPEDQTLIDIAYSYNWRKTSPMQFFYRIYQKTKVLTRKRKKKRTKTGSKNQPAKKRRHIEAAWKEAGTEAPMEVDTEPTQKLTSKFEKSRSEKLVKGKLSVSPKSDKKLKADVAVKPAAVPPVKEQKVEAKPLATKGPSTPSPTVKFSPAVSSVGQKTNIIKHPAIPTSKKLDSKSPLPAKPTQPRTVNATNGNPVSKNANSKSVKVPKEKPNLNSKSEAPREKVPHNGLKSDASAKKPEPHKANVTNGDKSPNRLVIAEKKPSAGDKGVVEISVEVSASDVKKVLEKKRAEKDAKLLTSGEEKLYSNYSIVDQIKKAGSSAANLARQQTERASMMDFARSSEALNAPKVPPTIQGLQPKVSSSSETNVLSAIVQNLAQKQQKLQSSGSPSQDKTKESFSTLSGSKSLDPTATDSSKSKQSEAAKTLGTIVAPALSTKTSLEKQTQPKPHNSGPKLPTSTSIKPILRDGKHSPTSVETSGAKGQQMLNFYKNSFITPASSMSDAAKSAETLTKNIPAGTTVTVKTVENNKTNGKLSPGVSTSPVPTSPKHPAFKPNFSTSNLQSNKIMNSPFSTAPSVSTPPLMNPFVHSTLRDSMTMAIAAQQAQYLNFSNQGFGAAAALAAAQMEAANNYVQAANIVRAAQAAAHISQAPMTTVAFTQPTLSRDDGRFGLKIPTPNINRHQNPSVSSFGTSRLQVKVNSDAPRQGSPVSRGSKTPSPPVTFQNPMDSNSSLASLNGKTSGTHCMPAILPFHSVKKVQALPKTVSQSPRPVSISSVLKNESSLNLKSSSQSPGTAAKPLTTSVNSLTDSNPFKTLTPVKPSGLDGLKKVPTPPSTPSNPFKPVTQAQVNSLKKLAADLNTVHQKTLKGDNNILSSLKKNNENKLCGDVKSFGLEVGKQTEAGKEVKSS